MLAYTFSGLVLSVIVLFFMIKFGVVRVLPAFVAALCGYFIAKSQYDPIVQDFLTRLGGK